MPTPRARDPLWDALEQIFGFAPATKTERSLWGKLLRELREAEATPQTLRFAAERWPRVFPRATFTPSALVKHYSQLTVGFVPRDSTDSEERARRAGWGS